MPAEPTDEAGDLRSLLEMLDPLARDALRRVLLRDEDDRDVVSSWLLRYRDGHGDAWADSIDLLCIRTRGDVSRGC
jgi:hypothetical protein